MAEAAYVTLEEAAELEGVSYEAIKKKAQRCPEKMGVRKEKRESGGKELTMVAVNSLSKQGRNAWKERENLKALAADPEDIQMEDKPAVERPWYVDTDIDWYMHNFKSNYYKAAELGNVVREYLAYDGDDLTGYTEKFAQERLGISGRTLHRYAKDYRKALAWMDRLEKEDGCSYEHFKVLCLCRKPKDVGNFPSIRPEVKQTIKNIWFNKDFAENETTRMMLYEKLEEIAEMKEWGKLPSYQTVSRYIHYLMTEGGMKNAHFLAAKGVREYKNKVMVKRRRDTKSLQVMEMLQGDEHTFDCWVTYKTPNGDIVPIRPKLVCWIDTRSRWIVGDVMCRDANSQILKQSMLKVVYYDAIGTPRYVFIDNGKDYTSREMNGIARKDRHNSEEKEKYFQMAFDDETRGFYRSMGIEDVYISMPYEPWTKAEIERFFGTVSSKFTKWLTSYTGTLTGKFTSKKVTKDIEKMAEEGKLLTLEEFYEKWTQWKNTKYANWKHDSLRRAQEEYRTPLSLFENGERYQKAAPPKSCATMLMMKSESRLVRNVGIERSGVYYHDEELYAYIGEKVNIKYDPYDMARIYVFDSKWKMICIAESQELLKFGKVADEALKQHKKNQNAQLRRDRELLEEANRPFEEVNAAASGYHDTVGGIELMIGKKPGKSRKVTQMPLDETYRKNQKKMKTVKSEYMESQAQKALEKLRMIGEG